tara:strand:- start:1007 stop:1468 length:462 start_codon:yes stop_codon:yes gene_type:complete
MSLVIFICPENPSLAKYCEAFYNYLTYGYRNWKTVNVVRSKSCISRTLQKRNQPEKIDMMATDDALERIYQKVITSDCYEHSYSQISDDEIQLAKMIVFITDNKSPVNIPKYMFAEDNDFVLLKWKTSKINSASDAKFSLFEKLIRKMVPARS